MNERRERIVKAIRLAWDSLDSHLEPSTKEPTVDCPTCGTRKFHAGCTKEYAYIISVLTELL